LLFPRRRCAVRLIEKMGLPIKSREASILIELVIWASKQNQRAMQQAIGKSLSVAELVLIAAARMANSPSATTKIAQELAVSPIAAENALIRLSKAARDLAAENGYGKIVEMIDRSRSTS
jgi:hypothetical protein